MSSQTAASKSANVKRIVWAVVGIVLALEIGFANPPEGLTKGAMWNLGLLLWAIVYWATRVFPDYVTGIFMVLIWIIGLKVPANVALGAFSGTTMWLIMSTLVFAIALIKTGLARRESLWLLRVLPPTYRGQVLGTLLAGIVLGPVVPNGIAKVTMLGPVVMGMADQSGYDPRSPGMCGLTLAVWAGCVPVGTLLFMTGGSPNLAVFAALPQAIKNGISWSGWFVAALPLTVLVGVALYLSLITMHKPESPGVSAERVQTELRKMGPMSVQEKSTAVVLAIALLFWITGNINKIDAAWVALSGAAVLSALNVVDRMSFRNGVDWTFWVYCGIINCIGPVMQYFKIDGWLVTVTSPALKSISGNPYLFLGLAVILTFVGRLVFANLITTGVLMVLILGPIAQMAGINPFLIVLIVVGAGALWLLPYINPVYLALYSVTQEKGFSHEQARKLNNVFMVVILVGTLLCVPYWRLLGLIK